MSAHQWKRGEHGVECRRCAIRETWPGARSGCTARTEVESDDAPPARPFQPRTRPSPELRAEVQAAGIPWHAYRMRRARGMSHEQALAQPVQIRSQA